MKKEILINFPHVELTCFALVLFFVSFLSVVVYAFHGQNKQYFEHISILPLEDE